MCPQMSDDGTIFSRIKKKEKKFSLSFCFASDHRKIRPHNISQCEPDNESERVNTAKGQVISYFLSFFSQLFLPRLEYCTILLFLHCLRAALGVHLAAFSLDNESEVFNDSVLIEEKEAFCEKLRKLFVA